jgi:purine-binding chemotaxis protein CheW
MEHDNVSSPQNQEKEDILQLVGFKIGKEHFGVNILMVQEIIRSAPITAVPNSPDFVEGVINLRGSIIPVIELRKRLNLYRESEHAGKDWILIVNVDSRVTGFIVDSVTQVLKIQKSSVEPPPDIIVAGLKSQYIKGVCENGKGLLILLDFSRILQVEEIRKLKEFNHGDSAVPAPFSAEKRLAASPLGV